MLLEVMQEPKICPYLDIPFQHADPALVRKMRRAMDGERALKLLEKIRQKIPDAAIRTSLIVGFPGEGRTEFRGLSDFVGGSPVRSSWSFHLFPEEGTSAYPLGDPIEETVKQKRKDEILEIQAAISAENLKNYLGRTTRCSHRRGVRRTIPISSSGASGLRRRKWTASCLSICPAKLGMPVIPFRKLKSYIRRI